jgi:CubicO group peptidase (beta-lactamase class C family)
MPQDDKIAAMIQAVVDSGELAGAATAVWRNGAVAQAAGVGWRDIDAKVPMTRDSLFRIASLTKPITSLAAMTLLEEGRFTLDEPITRWAPEFASPRVLRALNGPLDDTDPAARAITFDDLLTHRSGLTYGGFHPGPIAEAYKVLGADLDSHLTPDEWLAALGGQPLIDQPGAGFHYGHSTDVLGFILARMEGAPLGEVLQKRVFAPLGMTDTGFVVPPEKRHRRAGLYGFDAEGRLTRLRVTPGGATVEERPADMSFVNAGAGLWSTVDDYLKFARVFLGDGAVDGVRILNPETLALMTANRLTDDQRLNGKSVGMPVFGPGAGFGLGVSVVMDPAHASIIRGKGGVGTVGWPGAYGGWWQADPTTGTAAVLLMHNMVELEQIAQGYGLGGYGAILEFHALATAG